MSDEAMTAVISLARESERLRVLGILRHLAIEVANDGSDGLKVRGIPNSDMAAVLRAAADAIEIYSREEDTA